MLHVSCFSRSDTTGEHSRGVPTSRGTPSAPGSHFVLKKGGEEEEKKREKKEKREKKDLKADLKADFRSDFEADLRSDFRGCTKGFFFGKKRLRGRGQFFNRGL